MKKIEVKLEKDEFTGHKTVTTSSVSLDNFDDNEKYIRSKLTTFSLLYVEDEKGMGDIGIIVFISNDYGVLPQWGNDFLLLVDGEKLCLSSDTRGHKIDKYSEQIVCFLSTDILHKICSAKEIKYSLRGANTTLEGKFNDLFIDLFKVFEKYCFADEGEGVKALDELSIKYNKDVTPQTNTTQTNTTVNDKKSGCFGLLIILISILVVIKFIF